MKIYQIVIIAILFASCGKDDEVKIDSDITLNGTGYAVNDAIVIEFGFSHLVYITDGEIEYTDGELSFSNQSYLLNFTLGKALQSTDLIEETYLYTAPTAPAQSEFIFSNASIIVNSSEDDQIKLIIGGGTIKVSGTLPEIQYEINSQLDNGLSLAGNFEQETQVGSND